MQNRLKNRIREGLSRRSRRRRRRRRRRLKRGIFLLPNLLTTGSLFVGFYAIIAVIQGNFWWASLAILLAIVFDGLDGAVARLTKSASSFGMEFDSLSDLTAFGIAPSLLIYQWGLSLYGRLGWLAAFVFCACGALRLARFNVLAHAGDGAEEFRGLPITAAAGVIASLVFLIEDFGLRGYTPPMLIAILAYLLAFLMVSTIRYHSFKRFNGPLRHPFRVLVGTVLVLFVAAAIPQVVAFAAMVGYMVSGPISMFRPKKQKESAYPSDKTSTQNP